jgi:single-stranded DNA-specific DHH superfamily exonuclease
MDPGEIDRNVAGLVANKIMAKYQRPTCILTKTETIIQGAKKEDLPWDEYEEQTIISYAGSARGCDKTGINDFKSICLQTGVCNYAEGHPGAFGLSINE